MNLRNLYIRSDLSNNENPYDNRSDQKTQSKDLKNFKGVDIKHNSYSRYLGKKVANSLTSDKNSASTPKYGNKTRKMPLINCTTKC